MITDVSRPSTWVTACDVMFQPTPRTTRPVSV